MTHAISCALEELERRIESIGKLGASLSEHLDAINEDITGDKMFIPNPKSIFNEAACHHFRQTLITFYHKPKNVRHANKSILLLIMSEVTGHLCNF